MSQLLIDSGLLILHLRTHQPSVRLLRSLAATNQLFVSTITRIELRARMHPSEKFTTTKLLSRFGALPVEREVADRAGDITNALRTRGLNTGLPEIIIAATAITHNLSLVTLNRKHFEIIPGLRLYPVSEE